MKKAPLLTLACVLSLPHAAQAADIKSLGKSPDGRFLYFSSTGSVDNNGLGYTIPRSDFSTNPERMGKFCVSIVTDALKAPSTAKFKYPVTVTKYPAAVTVSGTVDAQNSYGAMLRNHYFCNFVFYGGKVSIYYDLY